MFTLCELCLHIKTTQLAFPTCNLSWYNYIITVLVNSISLYASEMYPNMSVHQLPPFKKWKHISSIDNKCVALPLV